MTPTMQELTKDKIKEIIAKRIAKEFKENDIITLGIGLPTEAANYVDEINPDEVVIPSIFIDYIVKEEEN